MAEKRFRVFVAGEARKELRKLGRSVAAEILTQVEKKLATRPEEYGEAPSEEWAGYYKLRVGGFRVVYRVVQDRVWVLVLAAGKRNEGNVDNIYDWLTSAMLQRRLEALVREAEEAEKQDSDA